LIESLLFDRDPWDPLTMASATVVLFAAGAPAGFLPSRRAASVEPTHALRSE
jgi:ABC-type lipoprotein release transport system permease subunit